MVDDNLDIYWLSNCCDAPPIYPVDEFPGEALGLCYQCKEPAIFTIEEEE
tara:strand:- start:2087 stop:2236 length:150 start_codon:yes stop_codon:yes gene_type:complete